MSKLTISAETLAENLSPELILTLINAALAHGDIEAKDATGLANECGLSANLQLCAA